VSAGTSRKKKLLLLCAAVVTDSGANIVKAVDIAFEKICTYRVVHTL
jgi:hypothetical protein